MLQVIETDMTICVRKLSSPPIDPESSDSVSERQLLEPLKEAFYYWEQLSDSRCVRSLDLSGR